MAGAEVSPHGVILHPYCRKTTQTQRFWEGVGGCWPQWGQGTLGTLPSPRLSTPGTWVGTPAAEGFQMHQFCFLPLRMKFSMEEKPFLVPEAPVALSWRWQGGHPISALFQAGKGSALSCQPSNISMILLLLLQRFWFVFPCLKQEKYLFPLLSLK